MKFPGWERIGGIQQQECKWWINKSPEGIMFGNNYITSVRNQSVCLFVLQGNAGEVPGGYSTGTDGAMH